MEFDSSNPDHAKEAIKAYAKNAGTLPDGTTKNTRGVWFSIEQLTSLLERLERERIYSYALASDVDKKTGKGIIDGIRVYFATYPEGYDYTTPETKDHMYRNTVFFISTKGGVDSLTGEKFHQDQFTREPGLDSYFKSLGIKKWLALPLDPENTGELSPPKIKGVDDDLLPID